MYTLKESIQMGGCWFYPYVTYSGNEVAEDRMLADACMLEIDVTDDFVSGAPIEIIEMQNDGVWEYIYTVDGEIAAEGRVPFEFFGWRSALRWVCDRLFEWYF